MKLRSRLQAKELTTYSKTVQTVFDRINKLLRGATSVHGHYDFNKARLFEGSRDSKQTIDVVNHVDYTRCWHRAERLCQICAVNDKLREGLPWAHKHATVTFDNLDSIVSVMVVTSSDHDSASSRTARPHGDNKTHSEEAAIQKTCFRTVSSCAVAKEFAWTRVLCVSLANIGNDLLNCVRDSAFYHYFGSFNSRFIYLL